MKNRFSTLCTIALFGASVCSTQLTSLGNVVIKNSHLKVNGISYFRGNAENVQIGSYGDKKTPVTGMNYLAVDGVIPREQLSKVQEVVVLDIDSAKTSKTDLFGSISSVTSVFGASADAAWEKIKSDKLKLVKLVIANSDIKSAANHSSKALSELRSRGKGARIANQVFVVLSAEIAETLKKSGSIDISGSDEKITLKAKASGSSSKDTTVVLSKGSIFAYGLVKLDWDHGKDKIEQVEDDKWSFD